MDAELLVLTESGWGLLGGEGPGSHFAEPWGLPQSPALLLPEEPSSLPGTGRNGEGRRGREGWPHPLIPVGRGKSNNYWKGKAVVSLLSKYLWNPRRWLAGEQALHGALPRRHRHGPQPGGAVRPLHLGRARPPAPSPALFGVLSTTHKVPKCFTPGRAIAAPSRCEMQFT